MHEPNYLNNYLWWLLASFLVFGSLVAQAVLWAIGAGRAHDCGSGILTAEEYASCMLKTDAACQAWHDNYAMSAAAIAMALVFVVNWYAFQYKFFFSCPLRFAGHHMAPAWAENYAHLPMRTAIFNLVYVAIHGVMVVVLFHQDSPTKITARACGNVYTVYIWALTYGTAVVLFLHMLSVWWYCVNSAGHAAHADEKNRRVAFARPPSAAWGAQQDTQDQSNVLMVNVRRQPFSMAAGS